MPLSCQRLKSFSCHPRLSELVYDKLDHFKNIANRGTFHDRIMSIESFREVQPSLAKNNIL